MDAPAEPTDPFRGQPVPLRTTVRAATWLSRRMRRLVLGGGDLDRFAWSGPAANCKLILPGPGLGPEVLPPSGGATVGRLDRATLTVRSYTPRFWDPEAQELTVDAVVHGHGPASTWAASVAPGDQLAVTRPLGRYEVDPAAAWTILAGDESALPAIATILAAATGGEHGRTGPAPLPRSVLVGAELEEPSADEEAARPVGGAASGAPVVDLPGAPTVTWVARTGAPGAALHDRLRAVVRDGAPGGRPSDVAGGRVWVACESGAMLAVRRWLLDDLGMQRRQVASRGYWTATGPAADAPGDPPVSTSPWLR